MPPELSGDAFDEPLHPGSMVGRLSTLRSRELDVSNLRVVRQGTLAKTLAGLRSTVASPSVVVDAQGTAVVGLHASTGQQEWSVPGLVDYSRESAENGTSSPASPTDGTRLLLALSPNSWTEADRPIRLVALDLRDGSIAWDERPHQEPLEPPLRRRSPRRRRHGSRRAHVRSPRVGLERTSWPWRETSETWFGDVRVGGGLDPPPQGLS